MIPRRCRTLLLALVLAGVLGACERARVVLQYPDTPPDLIGHVLAVDSGNGVLVLRDEQGVEHSIALVKGTSIARRVVNLVTAESVGRIEHGSTVEIWLHSDGAGRSRRVQPEAQAAQQLIVVDLADALGTGLESVQPGVALPQGGLGPIP